MPEEAIKAEASRRLLADAFDHHRAGRLHAALRGYTDALATGAAPTVPLLEASAAAAWELGRPDEALTRLRQTVAIFPAATMAHRNLGVSAADGGDAAAALRRYMRAIACEPTNQRVWSAVASAQTDLGHRPVAASAWRRVLALDASDPDALYNLGVLAQDGDRWLEAAVVYRRALAMEPRHAAAAGNLGACLSELGRTAEAVAAFQAAVTSEPAVFRRRHALHLEHLKAGSFEAAWAVIADAGSPSVNDLRGRTVLLYDTCGFGDFIQFMRYAPLVRAVARQAWLRVPAALVGLARRAFGPEEVVLAEIDPPAHDVAVRLLDLPRLFGTTEATIPAAGPYLSADPERARQCLPRIDRRGVAVGFAWAGDPSYPLNRLRSPGLDILRPLLSGIDGVRFHALQVGAGRMDIRGSGLPSSVLDLGADIQDFDHTAAIIDGLDLVISPCTAVAHLSAALGKPTWVMLRHASDWRWMLGRDDSPWYPSLRLFRQRRPGRWDDVIEDLRDALVKEQRSQRPVTK